MVISSGGGDVFRLWLEYSPDVEKANPVEEGFSDMCIYKKAYPHVERRLIQLTSVRDNLHFEWLARLDIFISYIFLLLGVGLSIYMTK